jgi:DNA-binding transcriptional regulator GbsR (MarR family)
VAKVSIEGSRKDFYVAEKDVWEITARIITERQRREITPVREHLEAFRTSLFEGREGTRCEDLEGEERAFCERLEQLTDLMEVFEGFSQALLPFVQRQNVPMIRQFVQMAREINESGAPQRD